MKKNKIPHIIYAVITLAGLIGYVALADDPTSETISFTAQTGGTGAGCAGAYTGYAKMTNSAGTLWITPPTNTTSGTFSDASGFAAPYVSVARVSCNDLSAWCDTNSVTFPATNSKKYSLTVYVKSPLPPPTNSQPISLQVVWH